ncbi:choline O-acetyltransferase-like isoform X1 [Styela clava]
MPILNDANKAIPNFARSISSRRLSMSYQTQLPRLPVPDLTETLERYLLCVKPLVPEIQFEKTKQIVEEFGADGGIGETLQNHLLKRAKNVVNWSYDWWLDDMYLNNRAPLPVNSNPGMLLPKQNFKTESERLRFAGKLIAGIMDYKKILDSEALPVDIAHGQLAGQPLCMKQYYRLLCSSRLPGKPSDRLVQVSSTEENHAGHFVIAHNNKFHVLNAISPKGERISEPDIVDLLEKIVDDKIDDRTNPNFSVGVLTSMGRSEWAEARDILMQNPVNRKSIESIEKSIAVVCLDKPLKVEANDVNLGHQMLHGMGNSCNRWFDKTIQFIIGSDGVTGLVYEHSVSEGIAVISLVEHLLKHIEESNPEEVNFEMSPVLLPPECLRWEVESAKVKRYMDLARTGLVKVANNLDLKILRFSDYGKEFIKRQNISPDAYIQVALQLSFYKLYGHLVSTYESASTRRFREGRVDNIRAATVQALDFAKSVTIPDENGKIALNARNMMLLRKAIKAQTDYTIAAITGLAIDCHLVGLKEASKELKLPIPELFSDPSYDICNYFTLSTSQVPTNTDSFMCYGAVVEDGYGVSYNPHPDRIVFCISSFRSCPSTSSEKFAGAITESFRIMNELCRQWNRRRSSSLASCKRFISETIVVPRKQAINREMSPRSYSVDNDDLRRRGRSLVGLKSLTIESLPEEGSENLLNRKLSDARKNKKNYYLYSKRRSGGVLAREKMHHALSRQLSDERLLHLKCNIDACKNNNNHSMSEQHIGEVRLSSKHSL